MSERPSSVLVAGRLFLHPAFDYLLIGGGLSLLVMFTLYLYPVARALPSVFDFAVVILFCNSAHFAASTVRLYTKPDAVRSMPFLTMGFPLVALALLTLSVGFAGTIGPLVQRLYLTWSPYHYAAQAYGLSVMYCYRSGCALGPASKRLLWWTSMAAFANVFLATPVIGLHWILPAGVRALPQWPAAVATLDALTAGFAYASPLVLFLFVLRREGRPMPVISLLVIVANNVWWLAAPVIEASIWATVFHAVQYLAIVIIFHVKDQLQRPGNAHGATYHSVRFYALCLGLGYALFQVLPYAYTLVGFGRVESLLLVAAAINLHHFIVDQFIWRLKTADSNRRIVEAAPASAAQAEGGLCS